MSNSLLSPPQTQHPGGQIQIQPPQNPSTGQTSTSEKALGKRKSRTDDPPGTLSDDPRTSGAPGTDPALLKKPRAPASHGAPPVAGPSRNSGQASVFFHQTGVPRPSASNSRKKLQSPGNWHLKKSEIPNGARKTKAAFETHIRILWQLPHQKSIPPTVRSTNRDRFNDRYKAESEIAQSVSASLRVNERSLLLVKSKVQSFLTAVAKDSGTIANNIRRTPEQFLELIFQTVIHLGLDVWAPDILSQDPESMYNLLHEHIAIKTFEQISISLGYAHLAVDLSYVQNPRLLRHFYRSFVFSYMHSIAKLEGKERGSVAQRKDLTAVYDRRNTLRLSRVETLRDLGFSKRVIDAVDCPEAHSDDELVLEPDASGKMCEVYLINTKVFRSDKFTTLLRETDIRAQYKAVTKKGRKRGTRVMRTRRDRDPKVSSSIPTLPKSTSMDFFDPDFWNNIMTVSQKAQYLSADGTPTIVLPTDEHCNSWRACDTWKCYSEAKFLRKYGADVLALYQVPTEKELDCVLGVASSDDEDDEDSEDMMEDDEYQEEEQEQEQEDEDEQTEEREEEEHGEDVEQHPDGDDESM